MTSKLVVRDETLSAAPEPTVADLTVVTAGDVREAQAPMIAWCDGKIAGIDAERQEALQNAEHARQHKWKVTPFTRLANKLRRRVEYYQKLRQALVAGYVMVPNMPMDLLAVRVDRESPRRKTYKGSIWNTPDVSARSLPAGSGHYVSPQQRCAKQTNDEGKHLGWMPVEYQEPELPVALVKPIVTEAAGKALDVLLFDEIGIVSEGPRSGDPIILGRIKDPTRTYHAGVSFLVAWWIDPRSL